VLDHGGAFLKEEGSLSGSFLKKRTKKLLRVSGTRQLPVDVRARGTIQNLNHELVGMSFFLSRATRLPYAPLFSVSKA
jgi:hypothetical protein